MAKSSYSSILSGSVWGIIAKILDALAKFVTIPMLVGFYGKTDYGLIALAFSLNAYLRLMDLGLNIGSIRYFAMWITGKEWEKIAKVSKSSIVFYGTIGIINAIIFIYMAHNAKFFFKLAPGQESVFMYMMYILAISTIFNWLSSVLTQLLNAYGEQGWINRVTVVSSLSNFVTAFITVHFKLSLPLYFFLYTCSTLMVIPFNIYKLKIFNMPIWNLIAPKWDGKAFKEILGYSMSIFIMGLFQTSADSLRPLLLGKFASKGISVLTEYRVMQTITTLIMAFGAVFMQVLLPSASKAWAENNREKVDRLVYDGTKYISVFLSFVVFFLIVNSQGLLTIYMGKNYTELSTWLIIWLLTVLVSMHNSPIASLVLSTGKTKELTYASIVTCVVSLPITAFLAPKYNVGSAVIGFFVYILMQVGFYYVYYIPRVFQLSSKRLFFKSFMPSIVAGGIGVAAVYALDKVIVLKIGYLSMAINSVIFCACFLGYILLFVLKPADLYSMKSKMVG